MKDGVIITSNRDEQRGRPPALEPEVYTGRTGGLLYPKDSLAGGSWFVVHERGAVLVLLNGAGERHIPQPPYRVSRGIILLELADSTHSLGTFKNLNLNKIEPFTLILLEDKQLYECHWDGMEKVCRSIDAGAPHIWSSVTLYDPVARERRREWFAAWLRDNPVADAGNVLQFHQFSGDGDPRYDVVMNRENLLLTVSITSVQIRGGEVRMQYLDMLNSRGSQRQLSLTKGPGALPALPIPASL
jgi:hypothetical protein